VIRRLLLTGALAFGIVVGTAGAAHAANVVCAYNSNPLNIGVCVGV
jgi:hypothetical protein